MAGEGEGAKSGVEESGDTRIIDPKAARFTLAEATDYLQEALDQMNRIGDNVHGLDDDNDRIAAARVVAMAELLRLKTLAVLPELPFRPSMQVQPSPEALFFIAKAKEKARLELEEKEELAERTYRMLLRIFSERISELTDIGDISREAERSIIMTFARTYATKSGLDVRFVVNTFSDKESYYYLGLERLLIESIFKDESIRDLISDPRTSVFRAGVFPSELFEELIHVKVAAVTMDIEKAWQSRKMKGGEKERFISNLIDRAREYIESRFGIDFLGSDLRSCKSLPRLQEFARTIPSDAESYDILKKSHLLLKVMHIMILHESEVDQSAYIDNSGNLRAEINDFYLDRGEGQASYINPPRDGGGKKKPNFEVDQFGMPIDRVEVAEGKPLDSTLDKVFRKVLRDTTEIGDFARMRIFLTKEDCYDEDGHFDSAKTEKALEKLLGIIIARFGNDVDLNSLDWSVDSGKTNEASKGAHRGMHFNLKYKSSCNANGIHPSGEPVTKAIDVEVQLLAYMEEDAYEKDHQGYQQSRKAVLRKKLGLESGFETFVLDLISAISNEKYEFNFRSTVDPFTVIEPIPEEFRKVHERQLGIGDEDLFPEDADLDVLMKEGWILHSQDKLRLFVLLLSILTKENGAGYLANVNMFEYMERYFPGRLHKLVDQYSKLLRGSQFAAGGPMAYLKKVLEAKIIFVKNIMSSSPEQRRDRKVSQLLKVSHSVRVSNAGKQPKHGGPRLAFVSCFRGRGSSNPETMEMPYNGPIDLVSEHDKKTDVVDFYWLMQNGKKVGPVYRIRKAEDDNIKCYLLDLNDSEQELPLWILQTEADDGTMVSGKVYPYRHELVFDSETNRPSLVARDVDVEKAHGVTLNGGIARLTPSIGLDKSRSRFLDLVNTIAPIWRSANGRQAKNMEHPIVVT